MGWYDTHAHLADQSLLGQLDEVLARSQLAGVEGILCVAVDAQTSKECIDIANRSPMLRASVGIHPNYAQLAKAVDWDQVCALTKDRRVVALGETGLDRYWDDCPFPLQLENFRRHWQLSRQTGLPVIVHMRDCEREMLEALDRERRLGPLNGVMHSYSGSLDAARTLLGWGLYLSFAGMVTFKKSIDLREIAAVVPHDRILVETDCPYLSPEPFRGQRPNEPARVIHTAEVVGKAQGLSREEFAERSRANTLRLFSRWSDVG
jgi:TatD DNase family protein